jgi:hypothetical protein
MTLGEYVCPGGYRSLSISNVCIKKGGGREGTSQVFRAGYREAFVAYASLFAGITI